MILPRINFDTRPVGVNFNEDGWAKITVWSPAAKSLEVLLGEKRIPLEKYELGYWSAKSSLLKAGDSYFFLIDKELKRPDPASLSQPEGVQGPSQAVDLSFEWTDDGWKAPAREDWIMYEIHTGTFSDTGDFQGISAKLDHLLSLGVNAIEIMPVAQFPGDRNWGYDGVFPYAVQHSYGGPGALQELVNACHQKGIAVILDVVYNHFGPEGNCLPDFGPYFTDKYKTPWGSAINFDDEESDPVRQFFIENVLMWFRDFHIDGLRMDAVHAIKDLGAVHILEAMKHYSLELSAITGKKYELIVELDLNDPRFINSREKGGFALDGQWIDEFHHALRVTAGGSRNGYYSDFNGIEDLAKSYRDAYVYDGQYSGHRKRIFGQPAVDNTGSQFVVFSQNHDQVGNRMLGERSSRLFSFEMQKLMAAAVMISPYIPMLFMGEEWGETNPFLYFVNHSDAELAEAVRKGRKAEFAAFHNEGEAPDPNLLETFQQSKLQWDLLFVKEHQSVFEYYRRLIRLRKTNPALSQLSRQNLSVEASPLDQTLTLTRWSNEQKLVCFLNFSDSVHKPVLPDDKGRWQKIFDSHEDQWLPGVQQIYLTNEDPGSVEPASISIYLLQNV